MQNYWQTPAFEMYELKAQPFDNLNKLASLKARLVLKLCRVTETLADVGEV